VTDEVKIINLTLIIKVLTIYIIRF